MQSRRGGLPARRGIHADRRVWTGDVSSDGEQRLKCSNTGLGCLDYKLPPRSIFFLLFLNFYFLGRGKVLIFVCILAEAMVTEHRLWESFPDFPFLFALVLLPHPSNSAVPWWFGTPCVFLTTLWVLQDQDPKSTHLWTLCLHRLYSWPFMY